MNAVCRHFAPRPRIHATRLPHGRRAAATRGAASRSSRAPITVLSLPLSVADCGERWGSLPPRAAKHQPEMSRRSRPRLASGVLSGASRQPGRLEGAPRGNLARPAVPPESGDRPAWEVAAQGWTSISRSETLTSQTSQTVPGAGQQNPRAVEASLSLSVAGARPEAVSVRAAVQARRPGRRPLGHDRRNRPQRDAAVGSRLGAPHAGLATDRGVLAVPRVTADLVAGPQARLPARARRPSHRLLPQPDGFEGVSPPLYLGEFGTVEPAGG